MRKAALLISMLLLVVPLASDEHPGKIPAGFTSIFNGANLAGWHVSMTNHHGNTREWRVLEGNLTGRQSPAGNGGVLLTDKRYKNFEVYLEVKPDFGCDGGLFLRSNAAGQTYQVMLDYLEGGNIGGIYGERLERRSARKLLSCFSRSSVLASRCSAASSI